MLQLREKIVHAADGTALYVEDWIVQSHQAVGAVVMMHGLGEHLERYSPLVKFFTDCNLSVRTYDHRGHGKSDGVRGDVPNGEPILQDAQIIVDDFAQETGLTPILFGHSMGGLFAARFALENLAPLRAVILSSPALALYMNSWQHFALKIMLKLAPGLGLPNGLQVKYLSHDAKVVQDYQHDPLVHSRLSARLLARMLAAIEYCQTHAQQLHIPCCLLVAGADRLVDPQGSFQFFAQLPKSLANMQVYPSMYHEIFFEPDAQQVFDDLREWLLERGLLHERDLPLPK